MPDRLEQMLREVGRDLDFPPTPDLTSAVGSRSPQVVRPRRPVRRALVLAVLTLLVAAATVMAASPGARDAVLEFFGIDGATVEVVPELPQAPSPSSPMGEPVSLAEAQNRVGFEIRTPPGRPPQPVYVSQRVPDGVVSFATAGTQVTQLRARVHRELLGKLVSEGTRVEHVQVGGDEALWLVGRPHVVFLRDADGRVIEESLEQAGNVLLLEHDRVLVRIEGASSFAAATSVARSLR